MRLAFLKKKKKIIYILLFKFGGWGVDGLFKLFRLVNEKSSRCHLNIRTVCRSTTTDDKNIRERDGERVQFISGLKFKPS